MTTCRSCFFCIPNYKASEPFFHWGTCYHAQRKVNANMTACQLYQYREVKMTHLSKPDKRNVYKDENKTRMYGYTLAEVLDIPLTIIGTREYTWGSSKGTAVKCVTKNNTHLVVEIPSWQDIHILQNPNLPKLPFQAQFVQKPSKSKKKNYNLKVIDNDTNN